MLLKVALLLSMMIQIGAAVIAIGLIRRTRYNVSWILISAGFVLMALRRLFDFSTLFWENHLFSGADVNSWMGILISLLMFIGVIFIRQIFNFQQRIDELRKVSEMRVLSAVIEGEEKARQNFARDLHDGLGPLLSSIKMTASAIDITKLDEANRRIVERTCQTSDDAIVSLMEISNHLSPHLLKNYGLTKALETFAAGLLEGTSIAFAMDSEIREKRYAYKIEITLYRIVSELLNNSLKHAAPCRIALEIKERGGKLFLSYQDDGIGFDPAALAIEPDSDKMGLDNIGSRIKSLNGEMDIHSRSGEGFNLTLQIPVK
ncbi:sensor histidine kinase [Prolixibacter sp. NT017]|uniref:sensor histidine kinase n=1 Tax=Prolixibacter sp. NT017 TaxID=2652390 RepID=UPI00126D44FD|nr:ATP-binding protein [Prolixibacter sp. NT017]GET25502.1 hypothetical protein NT017_18310 [Prolixibacter sp. NT017]